jgi:hypothetical protein
LWSSTYHKVINKSQLPEGHFLADVFDVRPTRGTSVLNSLLGDRAIWNLEVVDMRKSMIVTLFWGSLIGLVAGLVLMGTTVALAISNDIFVMSGPDVTGIKSGALSWTLLGLIGMAVLLLLFAAVAHFVAWIGAVLNTAHLPDKTWCVVLLVVGLLGLVFIATVAYVIAGPDGVKVKEEAQALLKGGPVPEQAPTSTMTGPR